MLTSEVKHVQKLQKRFDRLHLFTAMRSNVIWSLATNVPYLAYLGMCHIALIWDLFEWHTQAMVEKIHCRACVDLQN